MYIASIRALCMASQSDWISQKGHCTTLLMVLFIICIFMLWWSGTFAALILCTLPPHPFPPYKATRLFECCQGTTCRTIFVADIPTFIGTNSSTPPKSTTKLAESCLPVDELVLVHDAWPAAHSPNGGDGAMMDLWTLQISAWATSCLTDLDCTVFFTSAYHWKTWMHSAKFSPSEPSPEECEPWSKSAVLHLLLALICPGSS